MMKKRKSPFSSRKRGKSPARYGLEAAVLCILLLLAAYVSGVNRPSSLLPQTQKTSVSQKKDVPAKKELASAQHAARSRAAAEKSSTAPDTQQYRLVRVSDGDSFELKDGNNRSLRIRLYGVDAPEGNQRFGRESREHLLDLMKHTPVRMKTMYKDRYQRTVAIVYLCDGKGIDERSVNQRQVQAGMAWVYDSFCKEGICSTWKIEEALARKQKLGLWQEDKPTPPWEWRRAHRR